MNKYTLTSADATNGAKLVLTETTQNIVDSIDIIGTNAITVTQSNNRIDVKGTDLTAANEIIAFALAFG